MIGAGSTEEWQCNVGRVSRRQRGKNRRKEENRQPRTSMPFRRSP